MALGLLVFVCGGFRGNQFEDYGSNFLRRVVSGGCVFEVCGFEDIAKLELKFLSFGNSGAENDSRSYIAIFWDNFSVMRFGRWSKLRPKFSG